MTTAFLLSVAALFAIGFAVGNFMARYGPSADRIAMLEKRVAALLQENEQLLLQLALPAASLGRVVDHLPTESTTIRWTAWKRTLETANEWERWDEADRWYLSVDEHEDGRWGWHAAYAPDEAEDSISTDGVCDSQFLARRLAQDWADEHARRPELLMELAVREGENGSV